MEGPGTDRSGRDGPSGRGFAGFGTSRLLLGGAFFLAITIGVFWHQFRSIGPGEEVPGLDRLQWPYLLFLLLLLPVETLLAGLRMRVICRVLQPEVSFLTCIKAELSNLGIAILTPSQTGGGLGQMYMLNRGGARMGTALTISLLSFLATIVTLVGMGLYTLFAAGNDRIGPLFTGAALAITVVCALILLSVAWPGLFREAIFGCYRLLRRAGGKGKSLGERPAGTGTPTCPPGDRAGPLAYRLVEVIHTYREDFLRFLGKGKTVFLLACLLTAAFFFSRFLLAFCCVRFLGIGEATLGEILEFQMALLFVTYFGPTPGSAGIAEGASLAIMGSVVPPGYAPYYNLLWRFSTVYLAACGGMILLACAIVRDMREGYRRRREIKGGSPQAGIP